MKLSRIIGLIGLWIMVSTSVIVIRAQNATATCSAAVENALLEVDQNCADLGRNVACYGFTQVEAAFYEEVGDDFFAQPTDRTDLALLSSLRTSPFNQALNQWGIALMKIQANLPNTLPGQGVVVMLLGDTEITSQTPPDSLFNNDTALEVTTTARSRIRSGAGLRYNALVAVDEGTSLIADGISEDREWARVVYNDEIVGWIARELVSANQDLATLPALTQDLQTSMQAFYFTSGVGDIDCEEAPNALLVQSPQHIQINLTVNEAQITLGSTALLETLPDGRMVLYMLDGQAEVNGLIVPQGYKAFVEIQLDEERKEELASEGVILLEDHRDLNVIGDVKWEACEAFDDVDREHLKSLTVLTSQSLNYPVTIPEEPSGICDSPENIAALAQRQSQENQGSGGSSQSSIVGIDCSGFVPTSPFGSIAFNDAPLYWNPASGATSYQVDVLDSGGQVVVSTQTSQTTTMVSPGGNVAGGSVYTWQVTALDAQGNSACTTAPVLVTSGAQPAPAARDDYALGSCAGAGCGEPTKKCSSYTITYKSCFSPHSVSTDESNCTENCS